MLLQKTYIIKICDKFATKPTNWFSTTPIDIVELLSFLDKQEVFDVFRTFYRQKVGLFFFAAIIIRLNIAFAVSKLFQFNQQPGKIHYKVLN